MKQWCAVPIINHRFHSGVWVHHLHMGHAIDAGCTVPGCDQPPYNCQVHHLIDWTPDGTTDIDRLTLTCQDGNLSAGPTDEQWQGRRRYDEQSLGQTLWYPPKSVDPNRQPMTNRYHRKPKQNRPKPDAA